LTIVVQFACLAAQTVDLFSPTATVAAGKTGFTDVGVEFSKVFEGTTLNTGQVIIELIHE